MGVTVCSVYSKVTRIMKLKSTTSITRVDNDLVDIFTDLCAHLTLST